MKSSFEKTMQRINVILFEREAADVKCSEMRIQSI